MSLLEEWHGGTWFLYDEELAEYARCFRHRAYQLILF